MSALEKKKNEKERRREGEKKKHMPGNGHYGEFPPKIKLGIVSFYIIPQFLMVHRRGGLQEQKRGMKSNVGTPHGRREQEITVFV